MSFGFWEKLSRPIMALAPMANVTDAAFRRIIAKYGRPDVIFTEFVSADGLMSEGRDKLLVDLMYSESERPIVVQLFSGKPEKMFEAAKLVKKLGFDGLDINMGCPDRSIEKSGAGAALIKDPKRAREVLRAGKEGVRGLPVSIKTRLGYSEDILEEWLPELLAEKPAAITIHARTRKEMSKVPAHWDRVAQAVKIRDGLKSATLILGNGDVASISEAREKVKETGADGVMLGRAIFGNPWLFAGGGKRSDLSSPKHFTKENVPATEDLQQILGLADSRSDLEEPPMQSRLRVMVEHTRLFEELLGRHKSFAIMKKHFKAYVQGFPACAGRDGAKELRMTLMTAESSGEVERVIQPFLEQNDRQKRM